MWIHIQRIAHTDTNPPWRLGWAVLGTLLAVSIARPALSDAPAAYGALPQSLPFDWFYLFVHPLMYASSPLALWWITGVATLALLALPLVARTKRAAAAVNLARCTGCGHCAHDCPYLAISLVPRADGRAFLKQAVVRAEQCAACGICAGSCPTAVPSARGEVLPGIDLPGRRLQEIKHEIDRAARRAVVFRCRHEQCEVPPHDACVITLECAGQLPPSFVDHALRRGAASVVVSGCRPGACEYRLGAGWTEARVAGTREPHLNATVPREHVRLRWWQARNTAIGIQAAAFVLSAALLAWLSFDPQYRPLGAGEALVRVIVVHAGERLQPCRRVSAEELAARAPNMRAPEDCPRGRHGVRVQIELGGRMLVNELLAPAGVARDGAAQLYRRFTVPAGRHALRVRVTDAPRPGARSWERAQELELAPGRVLTIDFRPGEGGILFL
jgi:coenzyme F420-reducing hydrogenase delta subunit/NAD-dependent dihydropyrimidine dehydrogenase PreA subunit